MSDLMPPPALSHRTPTAPSVPPSPQANAPGTDTSHPFAPRTKPLSLILTDLTRPIPSRLIKSKRVPTKNGGSYTADFVPHTTIRDLLDFYAPGWEWNVRIAAHDGKMYVVGTLTLHGIDANAAPTSQSRDGIGNEDSDLDSFGDPSSNAEAQALRRAAMAHGLGRALWKK